MQPYPRFGVFFVKWLQRDIARAESCANRTNHRRSSKEPKIVHLPLGRRLGVCASASIPERPSKKNVTGTPSALLIS